MAEIALNHQVNIKLKLEFGAKMGDGRMVAKMTSKLDAFIMMWPSKWVYLQTHYNIYIL